MIERVAVIHHPQHEGAAVFAEQVTAEFRRAGVEASIAPAWDDGTSTLLEGVELAICVGGDGTVLRTARAAIPHAVPILGVNMGRLGFLTDLSPRDFFNRFEQVLAGEWRVEERAMVAATAMSGNVEVGSFHGLNDVVVGRRSPGRPVYVDLHIEGARVAQYRCDGMIVATPTGSTGYSLSAGGPILAPTERHLVVTPVSPHLALGRSLVVPPASMIEIHVATAEGAILSVDGQEDVELVESTRVTVSVSEHLARFASFRPEASFYADLAERLETQLSSVTTKRD